MIDPEDLRALCQRVIQSGDLGRSRTYAAILEYLAEQAITGTTPKEISIAIDVLGRGAEFDVGKDSIVRVHIYHLRNKLEAYFARHGKKEKYRLEIPKGQYMLVATVNEAVAKDSATNTSITGKALGRKSMTPWLAGIVLLMLLANFYEQYYGTAAQTQNAYATTPVWQPVLDDDMPVLILIGDYYIMGETDTQGNIRRMVREFNINSTQDLELVLQNGNNPQYMNLDLSYTPTSVPKALAQVLKVFGNQSDRVTVKLMSDFSSDDLVGSHVIYLGYLSGMQSLADLMFAASGLAFGDTYDELISLDDDSRFISSSGLSTGDQNFRDYGMLSTFPSPSGTQYVFIAGMRDEGLINLAEEVSNLSSLSALSQKFLATPEAGSAFEALYEVLGFSRTNMDAALVYSKALDTKVLWENRLIGL